MSRYVLYLGGPRVQRGWWGGWWVTARIHISEDAVSRSVGVKIPSGTYWRANMAVSQSFGTLWNGDVRIRRFGVNDTALLPLEV